MAVSIRDSGHGNVPTLNNHVLSNPPFDSRTGRRGGVDSTGKFIMMTRDMLKRGYMITDVEGQNGRRYALNFQYNPTSFAHSASLQADIPTLGTEDGGSGQGKDWSAFVANSGQSVDFSLLFDRTYETWVTDKSKPASLQGCLADIKVLYAMLGLYYSTSAAGGGGTVQDPLTIGVLSPTGVLQATPVWIYFGPLMQYYGIIQSLNVTFTHFTQDMTPVRAAVNLSMAVLPRGGASTSAGPSTIDPGTQDKIAARQEQRLTQNGRKAWITG